MTSANRVQIAFVRESTLGTTPASPRMRAGRITSASPEFSPEFVDSDELRQDRMLNDPIRVMQSSRGQIAGELHYPEDNYWLSEIIRSAMFSSWNNMPQWDNDGVADSVITDVNTTPNQITIAGGASVSAVGHLMRTTGFANAANNGVFRITSFTSGNPVFTSPGFVTETAPPAAARAKVVGFEGVLGDITATATGLASTTLNFTTLGLAVGQWIKIGGTAAGQRFTNVPANNAFCRITAIAANTLTLDNRPAGWGVDNGSGKTIRVWVSDWIRNGVTKSGMTIESGFMGQQTPTYIVNRGMIANTLEFTATSRQKVNWSAALMGMGGGQGTTALDAVIDAASVAQIMAANANVGRLAESGAVLVGPNFVREFTVNVNNNIRQIEALDQASPVDLEPGECQVTGRINAYFGNNALLTKFYAGTPTALNVSFQRDGQAVIFDVPRATYRGGGNPGPSAKNTDVMIPLDYQASFDPLFNAHLIISRFEYFEQ